MHAVKSKNKNSTSNGNSSNSTNFRVYARRKISPLSPPTTLEIHGMRIYFPYKPYPCQELYMKKITEALLRSENALLESPTGTGKTLCLLCACLAWQREQAQTLHQEGEIALTLTQPEMASQSSETQHDNNKKPNSLRVPTIIYASRTHSQLSQVVRELRSTRYRPRHAVLGSREQMCVNPKIKKPQSSSSDIDHDCNKLGKNRKCRFRNQLEGFQPPSNEVGVSDEIQPVMDMEDLITMGKTMNVCPFYYTRSQVEKADLILMPYNYLFDKDARTTTLADIPWSNAVVIFDEAHNLESFASESASFDLSSADIAGCILEVGKAMTYMQAMSDDNYGVKLDNLVKLKTVFLKLEDYVLNKLSDKTAYSGEFMMDIFHQGAMINFSNHIVFIEEVRKVNDLIMDTRGTGATRGSPRLEHFVQCLKRVFHHTTESRCIAKAAFYRVHVSPKVQQGPKNIVGRTVSYWCFAPSLAMEELASLNVRSILVTSGTLSPLPSYSMELGLSFPHTLENEHVISASQICVRVIGKGSRGKELCSSFERRKDGEYYIELGNTLVELAGIVPGGMLIFFPSYAVMECCLERWGGPASNRVRNEKGKGNFFAKRITVNNQVSFPHSILPYFDQQNSSRVTLWKSLLNRKAIVVEPRATTDLNDAIADFKRYLDLPKSSGCILMGVCRGKISEGMSFAHEQSRAVVITGLPFPPSHDPKVKMKQEYLNRQRLSCSVKASGEGGFGVNTANLSNKLSGNEWYTQQAHRAVNQAIGRVIRNKDDYGAVLLLDSRFDQAQHCNGLSKWLRPHIKKDEGLEVCKKSLKQFYKSAEEKYQNVIKETTKIINLQYEDDEPLLGSCNVFKKVALIRTKKRSDGVSDDVANNSYITPEQVIARLDVDSLENFRTDLDVDRSASAHFSRSSTVSNDDVFDLNQSHVMLDTKSNSDFDARKEDVAKRPTKATLFFTKATELLCPSEMASMKKAIVAMKSHGDNKDIRAYTDAATDVVRLVVNHEGLEATVEKGKNIALFLFFQLLPRHYRDKVEVHAFDIAFDGSALGVLCKKNLDPGQFALVKSYMLALLQSLWCSDDDELLTPTEYVSKAQDVLQLLLKADRATSNVMIEAFIKLVPVRLANVTRGLSNELVANLEVQRLKTADRSNIGEAALNENQFKLKSWQARGSNYSVGLSKSTAMSKTRNLATPLVQEKKINGSLATFNPYAKKTNIGSHCKALLPSAHPIKRKHDDTAAINPYMRKERVVQTTAPQSSNSSICLPEKNKLLLCRMKEQTHSMDNTKRTQSMKTNASTLTSFIEKIEDDLFTTQHPATSIQSNAPKTLICPICSNRCSEPCLSECGHMACLNCWSDWLKRSQTCPTCRVATTIDSIARMIYEKQPETGALRTLSHSHAGTKNMNDENDHNSDEELEIY